MLTLLHVDSRGDGAHRRRGIAHRREFRHEDLAVELIPEVTGEAHREPGLTDSPWSRQRDQSIDLESALEKRELVGPTHQPGGLGRDLTQRRSSWHQRRLEERRVLVEHTPFELT